MIKFLRKNWPTLFCFVFFILIGAFLVFYALTLDSYHRVIHEAPLRKSDGAVSSLLLEEYAKDLKGLRGNRYCLVNDKGGLAYEEGLAVARLKMYGPAIESFSRVLRESRDKELLRNTQYNLGVVHLERALTTVLPPGDRLEDLLVAKAHFEETLKLDPDHADARYNLEKIHWLFKGLGIGIPSSGNGGDDYGPGRNEDDY